MAHPITLYSKEKLLDPEVASVILQEVPLIIAGLRGRDAIEFAHHVEKELKVEAQFQKGEILTPLEEEYRKAIQVLRVVGLPFTYGDQEILEVFETSLVDALKIADLDILERLKAKLIDFPITTRDAFKEKIRKALHENKERLTQKYLILEDKETLGTVGNWLRDYIQNVGGGIVDRLKVIEYITNSKNVRSLSQDEQQLVKRLIDFYEATKISSLTPQGVEEFIGGFDPDQQKYFYINSKTGLAEEIPELSATLPASSPLPLTAASSRPALGTNTLTKLPMITKAEIELLKTAYAEKGGVLDKVAGVEEEVRALYKTDPKKVYEFIATLVAPADPTAQRTPLEKVLVALLISAEEGKLGELLTSDPRFLSEFKKYLKEKNKSDALHNLELNPKSPINTGPFLRFIMEERGGMETSAAARFAVRLGNLMKKAGKPAYFDLAYYDQTAGAFKWKI